MSPSSLNLNYFSLWQLAYVHPNFLSWPLNLEHWTSPENSYVLSRTVNKSSSSKETPAFIHRHPSPDMPTHGEISLITLSKPSSVNLASRTLNFPFGYFRLLCSTVDHSIVPKETPVFVHGHPNYGMPKQTNSGWEESNHLSKLSSVNLVSKTLNFPCGFLRA